MSTCFIPALTVIHEERTRFHFFAMKHITKLLMVFLIFGILSLMFFVISSLNKVWDTLKKEGAGQLESVREINTSAMVNFFEERKKNMQILVEIVNVLRLYSLKELTAVREIKKNQIEEYFSEHILFMQDVQENMRLSEGVLAFSRAFRDGITSELYKNVYEERSGGLTSLKEVYGFYDLFLIDTDGNVVFTVKKESDLGENLISGWLRESGLARAYKKGKVATTIVDFSWYEPSRGPASFIAAPLKDKQGDLIGVVVFQIPLEKINEIMNERSGMGDSGETYLIGPDYLMRSDSYLDPVDHSVGASFTSPQKGKVYTRAAREALAGKTGKDIIIDYNNNPVLSAWTPVKINNFTWALIAEVDVAEAFCPKDEAEEYFLNKYKEIYAYYDLFLINPDGYCFFTVMRESDYQTNFVNGKYSDTNLGKLVQKVIKTKEFGVADYQPYAPSSNELAAFIAQPLLHNGEIVIIAAAQLSPDAINKKRKWSPE